MNLPKGRHSRNEYGFTVIELMLVLAIIGILAVFVTPISFRFYNTQQQVESHRTVLETLRRAQLTAQYEGAGVSVGVKLLPEEIIIFEGDSYATRDVSADIVRTFDRALHLAGDSEVVFSPASGAPDAAKTFSYAHRTSTSTVHVFLSGLIE